MFSTRRSTGRLTPTRKLVKKGSSLRDLRPLTERIVLEKVLGVTLKGNSGLACSPTTGEIAYPAGCVIVIVSSTGQGQSHIVNSSRKTISSLAFSSDGKFLVSGESGHQPAVRVWDAEDSSHPQISEMSKGHKHGIQSVAFSPNMKYVVSVGFEHDMLVNIWNWREGTAIACNKVSSKVSAISFSAKGDYFVTVGVRSVKFWYIGSTDNANKVKKKIPLQGRPAILGEKRDNTFIDVACGLGVNSALTYSVTKSGLLCSFNEKRLLEKWVELRVNGAFSLAVNEQLIFCGCSDGIIRVFNSKSLQFIGSLPKPHCLGVDVAAGHDASHLLTKVDNASYPDTVAVTLDHQGTKLTCVYNDHSMYIWDIKDIKKIGKISSFLYHNSCIWGIEVFPDVMTNGKIPDGSFLTCSSDGTARIWNIETGSRMAPYRNIYSKELIQVIYTETDLTTLKDSKSHKENARKEQEIKPGLRSMKLSHDAQQLASGDRMGNIRIFDMASIHEIIKVEAHESEVLCIEYSSPDADFNLLASAGRDRLIHVFDCDNKFNLLQTIDDHSASITSIRFNLSESKDFQLISCSADKSVIFRAAQKDPELQFMRYTNVATKTTFYDMDIHPAKTYAVTAGQDRNMRVYDIASGKQLRSFKGAMGDDGIILKVLLDRSGFYAATSSSDKSLALYDFDIGECVAGMVGHSEIVTGLQFSLDCERLITVSGDGCIFVWKLPSAFCQNMLERMQEEEFQGRTTLGDVNETDGGNEEFRPATSDMFQNSEPNSLFDDYRLSTIHKLPTWAKKQVITNVDMEVSVITESVQNTSIVNARAKPEGRWAERFNPMQIFPDSIGEADRAVEGSPETKPFQPHLDLLANAPLEKRYSNGSLTDEPIFSENPEAVLQFYEKEIQSKALENLQSKVTVSRGSDVNVETIENCRREDEAAQNNDLNSSTNKENDEEIIYYPNEEDLDDEVASLSNDKICKTNPDNELINIETNQATKPDPNKSYEINEVQRASQGYKIPLKKRSIEDILQSPTDEVGYFEMRPGHSMDNLVIHEVEFALLERRSSLEQSLQQVPYDVKIFEDCGDEKEFENQNTESSFKDEVDEPTGDSISDEEDLLTTEIVPKWDELPEIPAPNYERADVESNKEFFIENFECLGSTPTEDKEEPLFQTGSEAALDEPLPFERNSFHRTSISARFIQRSKKSSISRSTQNNETETSGKENIDVLEKKNIELEKRREELESTKKRLEAMGFKSIDNWMKKHATEDEGQQDLNSDMDVAEGQKNPLIDGKQVPVILTSQPVEIALKICPKHKEPVEKKEIIEENVNSVSQKLVLEKIKVLKPEMKDESHENEADSSLKKTSELIAFFDPGQKEKTSKTKSNKKAEKVQTRSKQDERKAKNKDINGKTTLSKLKDSEKAQKSQNRKSFPFNITKLTKTKTSDKRRSVPKTNLSKAKSCGDLLTDEKGDEIHEQKPRHSSHIEEEQTHELEDLKKKDSSKIVDSELSELSAELSAALATPPQKLVEINLSRDYLIGNGEVSSNYRSLAEDKEKVFSSEVTANDCQEVVVNLVRAFERALDCHSKILNGDIKDNQRQGLSMLAATFTTIHESITECKNEREQRLVRSPKPPRNLEMNSEEHAEPQNAESQRSKTERIETQDASQQTEHVLTTGENEQVTPLLEKYSELLLKKFEEKMNKK